MRALVIFLALWAPAAAHAAGIRAVLDRPQATLDDELMLTISLDGSDAGEPSIPHLPDFEITSSGKSNQVQVINGRMTASVRYTFTLTPKREGSFTIPPISAEVDGVTVQTQPLKVRITAASASGAARDIFLTVEVSNRTPYQGEQVVYTVRLYSRVSASCGAYELPDLGHFLVEPLGTKRQYETTYEGREYTVVEERRALFPQQAGQIDLASARVVCNVDVQQRNDPFGGGFGSIFGGRQARKALRSSPLTLNVKPLPPPPPGFSGLVGTFDLKASLSRAQVSLGDSVSLTMIVSGSGNVQQAREPELSALSGFKVYDDKPATQLETSGPEVRGQRVFTKALVPLAAGSQVIPPITLVSFDPAAGRYQTASAGPLHLDVAPGEAPVAAAPMVTPVPEGRREVKVLGEDLLPIRRELRLSPPPDPRVVHVAFAASLLVPPALFAGLMLQRGRRDRLARDPKRRRRLEGPRRARDKLGGGAADATSISGCVRELIGDLTGREGAALTASEAIDVLRARQVPDAVVQSTRELLAWCDEQLYAGPQARSDAAQLRQQLERARALVGALAEALS